MSILDNTTAALALATVGIDAGLPAPHHITGSELNGCYLLLDDPDLVYVWASFFDVDVHHRVTDGVEFATATTEWDGVRVEVTANKRTAEAAA